MSFDHVAVDFPTHEDANVDDSLVGGTRAFWVTKRAFDIVLSLALLPLMMLCGCLLLVANPFLNRGTLFFVQDRMGRHGQPFVAFKFRSMTHVNEITRHAEDPIETHRITPLGQFIRRLRIDELPQIINVLKGEMSIIGPRPDAFHHATTYMSAIPEYRARHAVRPGISGLAQVTLGYAQGLELTRAKAVSDLTYIQNAGPALDAKIVWLTLVTIFLRRGL